MINQLETSMRGKRRRMIQTTNILLFVVVLALAANNIFQLGASDLPWPAIIVALFTLANTVYIHRNGSLTIATWAILSILFVGLVFSTLNNGAFTGPTVLLSPALPVLAISLMSSTAGWLAMGLVTAILSGLFVMEFNGRIAPNPHDAEGILIARFLAIAFTSLVCTTVAWVFANYLRELVQLINNQANTDHLTGVANRRALETTMLREAGRARRSDTYLSLIMTDVDNFKHYNDKNGHPGGDRCLVAVADTLTETVNRTSDFVGRFGGEEFVVVLPDTDHHGACKLANEIRRGILKK